MIVSWLTYAFLVAGLVSAGALVAERAARAQRWPTRWVWAGAMGLTAGLPLATWAAPADPAPVALPALSGMYVLETLPALSAASSAGGPSAAEVALAAWVAVSALLLLRVALLAARLSAAGRRWPRRRVDGVEVLVSRRTGPAAMGVVRGRVVVPEWALALDARRRRLLVLHEAEHVRARDPQLALAGLIVCALAPWLLPLWWQLSRLRLAIETDCDARVLRRDGDRRSYGSLLLEVGHRRAGLAVALMESESMLERRIRMIASAAARRRTGRAAGLAGVAAVLLAVACETPAPTEVRSPDPARVEASDVQGGGGFTACAPLVYVDAEPVSRSELDALPPAEIGEIHVFKGAGVVARRGEITPLPQGDAAEDPGEGECGVISVLTKGASAEAVERVRAMNDRLQGERKRPRRPIGVDAEPSAASSATRAEDAPSPKVPGPAFTPMTERPSLRTAEAAARDIAEFYPPLLRDAGIGGTVNVWFYVDETGRVVETRVNRSSGHEPLDRAALAVGRRMEFTPARNGDRVVPVWVALDIRFEPER